MKRRSLVVLIEKTGGGTPGTMDFSRWVEPVIFPAPTMLIKSGKISRKRKYRKIKRKKK